MKGSLESYVIRTHCEMCGRHPKGSTTSKERRGNKLRLEPAFDPHGRPKTLCYDCRIGSSELLAEQRHELLEVSKAAADLMGKVPCVGNDGIVSMDIYVRLRSVIAKAEAR